MAERDLQKEYDSLLAYRDAFLEEAEEISFLTMPSIRVRDYVNHSGTTNAIPSRNNRYRGGSYGNTKPFTSVGRNGVSNLANTLLSLLFPVSVGWSKYILDSEQEEQLLAAGITNEQIEDALSEHEDKAHYYQDQHQMRSKLHALLVRNLIEGNNILHLHRLPSGETSLRIIPFRDLAVVRRNGQVVKAYIRDETEGPDGKPRNLFTCVDYETGEVYRQEIGGKRKTAQKVKDKASYYIVATSTLPTVEDYAESYAHTLIGDLQLANSLTRNIDRAYAIYSKTILVNDSGQSGVSVHDLADLQPGEAIEGSVTSDGRAAGIGFVSAGIKPNETAVAAQWLERVEDNLSRQFGGGIGNIFDNLAQPRSATEIAAVSSELDKFISGLGQHYVDTLLKPLAKAYLDLIAEESGNESEEISIRPSVIAGASQLSRLQELSRFMQLISTQLSLNPQFAGQIKWREVWNRMTRSLGLDTDGLLKTEQELEQERQQLIEQQQAIQAQQQQIDDQQLQALRQQRINSNLDG